MPTAEELRRLDRVVDHIETHPEGWDQGQWVCDTAACIAGRTALMDGWQPYYSGSIVTPATNLVIKDGVVREVAVVARKLLGLDWDFANELFHPTNDLDDIQRLRAQLHELFDEVSE